METRRQAYALAVSCQEQVDISGRRVRVDDLTQERVHSQWQRHNVGNGAKGPRLYDWMKIDLNSPEAEGWQRWLVVRQNASSSGAKPLEQAFFLVFARTGTPLIKMAEAIGGRWSIEIV